MSTSASSTTPSRRTDRASWVVQGWVVTDPEVLSAMDIPQGEACVEIPDRLVPFFGPGR
jgi:hypothetical protein